MSGKLIVFEGIDGSGKHTQSKELINTLKDMGKKSVLIHFPCYSETFFGKEVGNYLNGVYGSLEEIHPKLASMLYAGDRFEKKNYLLSELSKDTIIVCDRYVPSNIAHHAAKFPDSEREEFKKWIENLEYNVYGLPRPELVLFLDMPPNVSKSLVLKKDKRDYTEKKQDLHEENQEYLHNVYNVFCDLTAEDNWIRISCCDNNKVREISIIASEIKDIVFNYLS